MANDTFASLSRFRWRGIEYPCIGRTATPPAHEQVKHALTYKDGEFVEGTGSKNWTFNFTLPFREGIFKGPAGWSNLYSRVLIDKFLPAYLDRTPGELIDPFYGPFRCKPMTMESELDVKRRDGEDVKVVFEQAPEQDTTEEIAGTLASVEAIDQRSAFLDASINTTVIIPEGPPLPTLVNPLDALSNIGSQLLLAGDLVAAKFDAIAFKAEKLENTISKLADVQNAPVIRSLRRLRSASGRLQQTILNPAKIPITVTVPGGTTLTAFSAVYNMSIADLRRLNPRLPLYLKQGSSIKVYPNAGPL